MPPASALIAALLATLVLGVVLGARYLARGRRNRLRTLHLAAALLAVALVGWRALAAPGGALALALVLGATALGYGAARVGLSRRGQVDAVLFAHLAAGIAGFFVVLAWIKG